MEKKQNVIFMADDTFSGPFWDEEWVDIGDCEEFFLEEETIDVTSITELKSWYSHADEYDPFSAFCTFNPIGYDDWVLQGYHIAVKLRAMLPSYVYLYYGYMHDFGDGKWRCCKVFIS